MKEAIVFAGSRGIGRAIADSLTSIDVAVKATSSSELDTSNLEQVDLFVSENSETDILVLNTGGPPAVPFSEISRDQWEKYHNQLFLSFCTVLQKIKVRDGGFIFLVSSFNIKEPNPALILSNCYRIALVSVLKSLSVEFAQRGVSYVNIAPGPIRTDRLNGLVDDMAEFEKTLPMGRVGEPSEIGDFVAAIVERNIKYLSGVTINFDGASSKSLL